MKRLLLITLVIMAFVLVGVLQGGHIQEERAGDKGGACAYSRNLPEKIPGLIFDAAVFAPPLR